MHSSAFQLESLASAHTKLSGIFPSRISKATILTGSVLFCVFLLSNLQLWVKRATLSERNCVDKSKELEHAYRLNPKYGTEFEGKEEGYWNDSCSSHIRRLLERDELRLRPKMASKSSDAPNGRKYFPIFGQSLPDGLYYIAVGIGSPLQTYFLDIDTGSDLTWISCDAPCVSCAKGPHAWYNPSKAQLVSCKDPVCGKAQVGSIQGCSTDLVNQQCDYDVHYGDGSTSQGVLVRDQLAFLHPEGKLLPSKISFGCAYDQSGPLLSASGSDGVMGLGSSPASVPSQLAANGLVQNVVGHCLTMGSWQNGVRPAGGFFFIGKELVPPGMAWTPMLGKPQADYYYVGLERVKYGSRLLAIDPEVFSVARGGAIFDSGASFTYLATPAFKALLQAVNESVQGTGLKFDDSDPKFPNCWKRDTAGFRVTEEARSFFKVIELHIGVSGWFSKYQVLSLSPLNFLIVNAEGAVCLSVFDSGSSLSGGAATVLGDNAFRGLLVVYDNVKHLVGWIRQDCTNQP